MAEKKDDIVLSIRGMSKSFGRNRVLDHINQDVKRGTGMGLMAPRVSICAGHEANLIAQLLIDGI